MPAQEKNAVRAVALVRAGWGALLLTAPQAVLRAAGHREPSGAVTVVRVLGARHLAQGLVTAAVPTGPVVALGAVVDGLHAASQFALAAAAPRWRRAGLADGLLATAFGGSRQIVHAGRRAATNLRRISD
jgi:hypothetical protein